MAQFWFDRLDGLADPGRAVSGGDVVADAAFISRAPALIFEDNRAANAASTFLLPGITTANLDVRFRFRSIRNGAASNIFAGPALTFRYTDSANHYYFGTANPVTGTSWGAFVRVVANTALQINGNRTVAAGALFSRRWVRIRVQGAVFQYSTWADGAAEPDLINLGTLDVTGAPASGRIGVLGRERLSIFEVDRLSVGTDGDVSLASAPGAGYLVRGVVRNSAGSPVSRPVRVYRQDTGVLLATTLSNGTTGQFVATVDTLDRVYALSVDEGMTPSRAVVVDAITPVIG